MQIVEQCDVDTERATRDCKGICDTPAQKDKNEDGVLLVKVLGPGCMKCQQLHSNALEAAHAVKIPITVEYVTDISELAAAGIMSTPALLVGEKVVSAGKVLSPSEIASILES
ncbi:MAG: thioredoxin family protein [Gordonibacter sp.]|nr:thioredoxin family protein [Gordonibacter sp.]